jgi:hypothetical protein
MMDNVKPVQEMLTQTENLLVIINANAILIINGI